MNPIKAEVYIAAITEQQEDLDLLLKTNNPF